MYDESTEPAMWRYYLADARQLLGLALIRLGKALTGESEPRDR